MRRAVSMQRAFFVVLLSAIFLTGCRGFKPRCAIFKDKNAQRTDALWRQGDGYHNPNVERIKNEQEPLKFNGNTVAEDVTGRAVGNAIFVGIFEVVPGLFRGLSEKFWR